MVLNGLLLAHILVYYIKLSVEKDPLQDAGIEGKRMRGLLAGNNPSQLSTTLGKS